MKKFLLGGLLLAATSFVALAPAEFALAADSISAPLPAANPIADLIAAPPATAPNNVVSIPWGDWIAQAIIAVQPAIAAALIGVLTWLGAKLPAGVRSIWNMVLTEQVASRAIGWGLNAVAGAAKGKSLDVNAANAVVRTSLEYAKRHAPGLIARLGESGFQEKIIARLDVAEEAGVQTNARGEFVAFAAKT